MTEMIKCSKRKYYENSIQESRHNPTKMWKMFSHLQLTLATGVDGGESEFFGGDQTAHVVLILQQLNKPLSKTSSLKLLRADAPLFRRDQVEHRWPTRRNFGALDRVYKGCYRTQANGTSLV